MCFRLVPKSVTLNDLERRNGLISPNGAAFVANYVKLAKARPMLSARKCIPKNLFSGVT